MILRLGQGGHSNPGPSSGCPLNPQGKSLGVRYGRSYPLAHSKFAGLGGFSGPIIDPLQPIVPVCFPWTIAADEDGTAWPTADIVGVIDTAPILDAEWFEGYDVSIPADIEQWITDNMIPVPRVLPVGYTSRLRRDRHSSLSMRPGGMLDAYDVRTATGYTRLTWGACQNRDIMSFYLPFSVQHGMMTPVGTADFERRGWRNIRWRGRQGALNPSLYMGSACSVTISHNADGSDTGDADGDTIDYTGSISASDFSLVGGIYVTPWYNTGPIVPALGVNTCFTVSTAYTNTMGGTPWMPIDLRCAPRWDIPLPWSCTGEGGLIAPGGVIPGSLPGY